MTDLLVIGGGAAGLMAAGAACAKGLTVTVLEHNPKGPGQKLLITGKGRCNVTSDSDVREFLPYVRHNGRFLYSSLYAFPPASAMQLFEELGVPLKTERGRRVFPKSDRAADVLAEDFTGPALDIGDLIEVRNAGAYACTLTAQRFSSHTPPRELLVYGDGRVETE